METRWNLWHGCHKLSAGCLNCYVYRGDLKYGRDSSAVYKTNDFYKVIQKNKKGEYKVKPGTLVWTCFSSDFLLDIADEWRKEAFDMIRERKDLQFFFITKRIDRFESVLPDDWNDGWDNVSVASTCENQDRLDYRMPYFKKAKIKHKTIVCEPLLGPIDLEKYLDGTIEQVVVGGESGEKARVCNYEWVLSIREQCIKHDVAFWFKQTGTYFLKDNVIYHIARKFQHSQARKANINYKKISLK